MVKIAVPEVSNPTLRLHVHVTISSTNILRTIASHHLLHPSVLSLLVVDVLASVTSKPLVSDVDY